MINRFDELGLGFLGFDATPETCIQDLIWMAHLDTRIAEAGSCLYGDCEALI